MIKLPFSDSRCGSHRRRRSSRHTIVIELTEVVESISFPHKTSLNLVIFVRASASFTLLQIKAPQGTPPIFGRLIELGMRRRRDLLFLWIIEEPSQPIILAGASKVDAFNGFVFSDITFTVNQLPHVAAECTIA